MDSRGELKAVVNTAKAKGRARGGVHCVTGHFPTVATRRCSGIFLLASCPARSGPQRRGGMSEGFRFLYFKYLN